MEDLWEGECGSLVTAHIGPVLDPLGITVVASENFLSVRIDSPVGKSKIASGGLRGKVKEFSSSSRRRLSKLVNCLAGSCSFITLTYPFCYPGARDAKNNLRAFFKRIQRRFPQSGIVWKLEYQKRQAPHFHIFLFGVPFPEIARFRQFWFQIAKCYVPLHQDPKYFFKHGFKADCVDSQGARIYLAKYVEKGDDVESHEGRFWGKNGKIPIFKICRFIEKHWKEFFTLLEERLFELGLEELIMNQSWFLDPGEKIFKFLRCYK